MPNAALLSVIYTTTRDDGGQAESSETRIDVLADACELLDLGTRIELRAGSLRLAIPASVIERAYHRMTATTIATGPADATS